MIREYFIFMIKNLSNLKFYVGKIWGSGDSIVAEDRAFEHALNDSKSFAEDYEKQGKKDFEYKLWHKGQYWSIQKEDESPFVEGPYNKH